MELLKRNMTASPSVGTQLINGTVFDRELVVNGTRNLQMFARYYGTGRSSVIGATEAETKDVGDTNLREAGKVSADKPIRCTGFYLIWEAGGSGTTYALPDGFGVQAAKDIETMIASCHVQISINQSTDFISAPAITFPAPVGRQVQLAADRATDGGVLANIQYVGQVYEFLDGFNWTNKDDVRVNLIFNNGKGLTMPSGFMGRVTAVMTGTFVKALM